MQRVKGFMSIHLAATFTINILLGCLWLYVLFWDLDFYRNDPAGLVMLVFWFVVGTICLAVDLLLPAMVNSTVRTSFIFHYDIRFLNVLIPNLKNPQFIAVARTIRDYSQITFNEETATPGFQIQVSDGLLIYFHKMFLFLCFSLYLYNITGAAFSGQINRAANRTALNMFVIDKSVILTVC